MTITKKNYIGMTFGRITVLEQAEDHITSSGKHRTKLKCQFDNTCIVCGAVIPESHQVCPICGATESTLFEACKPTPKAEPQPEVKSIDEIELAYRKGVEEGMKQACEIKQENQKLKQDIAILRAAIERRDDENNQDGWFE